MIIPASLNILKFNFLIFLRCSRLIPTYVYIGITIAVISNVVRNLIIYLDYYKISRRPDESRDSVEMTYILSRF